MLSAAIIALAMASPTQATTCTLSVPTPQIKKDPALRIGEISRDPYSIRYSGTYQGASFFFIISVCESETVQLVVTMPADEDAWKAMDRLRALFQMRAKPLSRNMRKVLQVKGRVEYAEDYSEVEYDLQSIGVVHILSETRTTQR